MTAVERLTCFAYYDGIRGLRRYLTRTAFTTGLFTFLLVGLLQMPPILFLFNHR